VLVPRHARVSAQGGHYDRGLSLLECQRLGGGYRRELQMLLALVKGILRLSSGADGGVSL
jgi:hypothetical protein